MSPNSSAENQLRHEAASIEPTRQMGRLLETLICLERRNASGIEMKSGSPKAGIFYISFAARRFCVDISKSVEIPTLVSGLRPSMTWFFTNETAS